MTTPNAEMLVEPSFAEMFEESQSTQGLKPGELLTGIVTRVDNDFVIVDVGLKSEGPIPAEQFRNAEGEIEVKVGDSVLYDKYAGASVTVDGVDHLVLRNDDLIAIIK